MGSAHCLTERNLWVKLNENRHKGSGDIERTCGGGLTNGYKFSMVFEFCRNKDKMEYLIKCD